MNPVIRHNTWFNDSSMGEIIVETPNGSFYKYIVTSKFFYDQALLGRKGWYAKLIKNADKEIKGKKKV